MQDARKKKNRAYCRRLRRTPLVSHGAKRRWLWSLANLVSSSGLSNGVGESKGALPVSEHLRVFGKLPSQCIN